MKPLYTAMILGTVLGLVGMTGHAESTAEGATTGTVVETLLKRDLDVAPGKDVIIDHITLPNNTTLSRRWHPGEMFVYVLKGSVVVSPDGKGEIVSKKATSSMYRSSRYMRRERTTTVHNCCSSASTKRGSRYA